MQKSMQRWLAFVLVLGFCGNATALEPQVAFKVRKGFVELQLQKEGHPVPNAAITVRDHLGGIFAEGETGAKGEGSFPLPKSPSFSLEFRVEGRLSQPITLTLVGGEVVPMEVLLNFELRACCRIPSRLKMLENSQIGDGEDYLHSFENWVLLGGGALLLILGTSAMYYLDSSQQELSGRSRDNTFTTRNKSTENGK
jgi:hypothetical protein